MDECFRIPGTQWRFGWDSIVGLIPGVGDFVMGLGSLFLILEGFRLKVPTSVLLKMLLNILIEVGLGLIPVVGDLFDFVWKANSKNANLLDRYQANPQQVVHSSHVQIIGVLILILAFINLMVWGAFYFVGATVQLLKSLL